MFNAEDFEYFIRRCDKFIETINSITCDDYITFKNVEYAYRLLLHYLDFHYSYDRLNTGDFLKNKNLMQKGTKKIVEVFETIGMYETLHYFFGYNYHNENCDLQIEAYDFYKIIRVSR